MNTPAPRRRPIRTTALALLALGLALGWASRERAFARTLADQVKSLSDMQAQAASASASLAAGTATDPTAVVMAVERAQLAMQLASQIRTKAVEAAQTIFQTQV